MFEEGKCVVSGLVRYAACCFLGVFVCMNCCVCVQVCPGMLRAVDDNHLYACVLCHQLSVNSFEFALGMSLT